MGNLCCYGIQVLVLSFPLLLARKFKVAFSFCLRVCWMAFVSLGNEDLVEIDPDSQGSERFGRDLCQDSRLFAFIRFTALFLLHRKPQS